MVRCAKGSRDTKGMYGVPDLLNDAPMIANIHDGGLMAMTART